MQFTLQALTEMEVETGAGAFPVRDAIFDPDTGRVPFLIIDMGGVLTSSDALIRRTRITGAVAGEMRLTSDLSANDVHAAPHFGDSTSIDFTSLPPLVVGPFGTTQSPLLLASQLFGAPATPEAEIPARCARAQDWIGAPVFGPGGEIGQIADMDFDLTEGTVLRVKIAAGEAQALLPWHKLRNLVTTDESRHVVTDLDGTALYDSPPPDAEMRTGSA